MFCVPPHLYVPDIDQYIAHLVGVSGGLTISEGSQPLGFLVAPSGGYTLSIMAETSHGIRQNHPGF